MQRLQRRRFRDEAELSIVGFGGLLLAPMPQDQTNALVAWALERGVNYFDVGPSYPVRETGLCEKKLGIALAGRREEAFLACKTTQRTAAGAAREFDESLQRLRTDRFDLYQLHGVNTPQEVQAILAPEGAAKVLLEEKARGRCRYIGMSVHSEPAALTLMDALPLDSVMFAVNAVCLNRNGFGRRILDKATEKNLARLAIKTLARRPYAPGEKLKYPYCWYLPYDQPEQARAALYYTLSEDITAAVAPADAGLFRLCVELALDFSPPSPQEKATFRMAETDQPIFQSAGR